VARAHLAHCPTCRTEYVRHMRALRSGQLPRRIAELLPISPAAGSRRVRTGIWDTLTDWAGRPFTQDAANHGAQTAAGARGIGALGAAKLAALCIGGAAAVGGGAVCLEALVGGGVGARAAPPHGAVVRDARAPHEPGLPTAGRSRAMQPLIQNRVTHAARRRKAAGAAHPAATPAPTAAPTSTTSQHEQATAVSPPATSPSGSTGEFDPGPSNSAPPTAAAPASGGGPEFP
jgi:hypothetical protein